MNLLSIVIPTADVPWQVWAVGVCVGLVGVAWFGLRVRKGKP